MFHPTNDVWYRAGNHWGGYNGSLLLWPSGGQEAVVEFVGAKAIEIDTAFDALFQPAPVFMGEMATEGDVALASVLGPDVVLTGFTGWGIPI